uniref:C-type lectin domain-containing protein n=1 Tax=Naja naja TaxID=35670 RepID=A0A8C6VCY4_NAJNA
YWLRKPTLNPDDCKRLLAASEHGKRPCLTDWIWHQKKCFYFSDKEESWSASQDFCSFYNASLAIIEKEEMYFVQRYKGSAPHWIGLQREPKQPWKWVNGNVWSLLNHKRCLGIIGWSFFLIPGSQYGLVVKVSH